MQQRYPMTCSACGRSGTEDDGIEIGGECIEEDCDGTILSSVAMLVDRICEALVDDKDEYALDDTRALRLRIEPDDISPMDLWQPECYGKIAPVEWSRWENKQLPRPDGFDGRARKIETRDGGWWWQPPVDVSDEHVPLLMSLVTSVIREGFWSIGVELIDGNDAYRRGIVTHAAWVGGIEPMQGYGNDERAVASRAYYAEMIREQVEELLAQIEGEES